MLSNSRRLPVTGVALLVVGAGCMPADRSGEVTTAQEYQRERAYREGVPAGEYGYYEAPRTIQPGMAAQPQAQPPQQAPATQPQPPPTSEEWGRGTELQPEYPSVDLGAAPSGAQEPGGQAVIEAEIDRACEGVAIDQRELCQLELASTSIRSVIDVDLGVEVRLSVDAGPADELRRHLLCNQAMILNAKMPPCAVPIDRAGIEVTSSGDEVAIRLTTSDESMVPELRRSVHALQVMPPSGR